MPDNDPEREEILEIFQTLCGGYLKLQGKEGMWHQVLTFPHSFQETSCTAMFIYGFARGVRYGWLKNRDDYAKAALLGWRALCKIAFVSRVMPSPRAPNCLGLKIRSILIPPVVTLSFFPLQSLPT